jgi:hypothetical protein
MDGDESNDEVGFVVDVDLLGVRGFALVAILKNEFVSRRYG